MFDKDNELDNNGIFRKYENFTHLLPSGNEVLYRYLGENDDFVFAVKIGTARDGRLVIIKDDDKVKNRVRLSRLEVLRLLRIKCLMPVTERGIPSEMMQAEAEDRAGPEDNRLSTGIEDADGTLFGESKLRSVESAKRRRLVQYIDDNFGDAFMDASVYTEMVQCTSAIFRVDLKTVRKYYERHLFYGAHKNATVDQNWRKGGRGAPRLGLKGINGKPVLQGRKTDAEKLDPNTKFKRKRLSVRMLTRWMKFIWEHAEERGMTVRRLLHRFKGKLVSQNRGTDGSLKSYPIDPRHYPPEESMLEKGKQAFDEAKIELERRKNAGRQRGTTAQLARSDLDVLDIDGTVADQFLRFGNDTVMLEGAPKPTILIAVDRGSRAILGWYVTFGVENADAYLACVFSAYTDKERELLRWGVPNLDGMVFGCAKAIFVDRYAGMSEKVQRAIVRNMRQRLLIAEPGNPKGKGDVENLIGILQKEIGNLPGSSYREPVRGVGDEKDAARRRNRLKLKNAPEGAVLTMRQFMQALLTAISKHNLTADVRHLRTKAMAEEGVLPVPKEVYLYNKSLRRGDRSWDWPEEKIFRNLSVPFKRPAPGGIVTIAKRSYTSTLLQQRAREYEIRNGGKSLQVEGFEMFISPLHLLWDDDGQLELLDATDGSVAVYGDGYKFLHDYISMLSNADLRKALDKARKHPQPEDAPQNVIPISKQKRMAKIDGLPTPQKRVIRDAAAATAQGEDAAALLERLTGGPTNGGNRNADREPAYDSFNNQQQLDIDW